MLTGDRRPGGPRHPNLWAWLGYLTLSGVATWPLLARFGREIGGDRGDAWQTLWGFWWWRHGVLGGGVPGGSATFCPLLRAPSGAPMAFQTWDLPAALLTLPLWGRVPEVSVYNTALFL